MKLERLHEYILPVATTLLGMGAAVYCGKLSGNGQLGTLAFIIAASIAVTFLLGLRQYIWVLIPMFWPLYGQVAVLPLPFAVRDLVVMTVSVSFLALMAVKIVRMRPRFELVDFVAIAMLVYMVTVFIRNPVGVNALGSERVGGRPYFDLIIGAMAYWVLSRSSADSWITPRLPCFILGVQFFEMALNMITFHFPRTAPILSELYTGVDPTNFESDNVFLGPRQEGTGRQGYFQGFGISAGLLCVSRWRPLTLITPLYWGRFLIFLGVLIIIGFSGFRSALITLGAYMAVSAILRRGKAELVPMILLAVPILAILIALQGTVINLPRPMQRALSFLPGRWDPIAVQDAKGSTQWRLDIWEIMLTEDKYIISKWLGDGFGFSQRQLAAMAAQKRLGIESEEEFLIVGNVHSGPLSCIRYAGYVGLGIFMVFLITAAHLAWRLARRALGTPYEMLAFYICIPVIWTPFGFVLIFGGFETALPSALLAVGMVKMLENSLDIWERRRNEATGQSDRSRTRSIAPAREMPALA